MGKISAITHDFRRENNNDNEESLYTAFRYVNGTWESITNKRIQALVADYISKRVKLHPSILESNNQCKTIKDYCEQLTKGKVHGGKAEVEALAMMSHLVIYIVPINKIIGTNNLNIKVETYNNHGESFKDCVYMIYNEENQHYDSLYTINKDNINEKTTIFQVDDPIIAELLGKFFRDQYSNSSEQAHQTEEPVNDNFHMETEEIENKLIPSTNPNVSLEGKSRKHSELSLAKTVTKDQNLKMKFEVEPALRFRGRTKGEFQPKKKQTRKGRPSKPRPPRYFADRNNQRVFNLLIPEEKLSNNAKYRVKILIITQNIRGNSYINSYFKFQVDPVDDQIEDVNPLEIIFQMKDLNQHSTGMKCLPIQFVVIKMTNSQLMLQAQQPLQIFSSTNNQTIITKHFDSHRTLKRTYRLQKLRFAVSLDEKKPGEADFHACDDAQYISAISTEHPKYTIN